MRRERRERILISEEGLSPLKLTGLAVIGLCLLGWVGFVHADNRRACAVGLTIFGTVMAMALLLLLAYSNPFNGDYSVKPAILQEVEQDITPGAHGS